MRENRNTIIDLVFDSEKGYVNRPDTDNGGPTNRGITQKTLSAWRGRPVSIAEVKNLTQEEAHEIYASEYWNPIRGDDLPSGLDYAVFDSCVTSGPNRAARILQMVLVADGAELKVDGNIGVHTLDAVKNYSKGLIPLIRAYCEERMRYMRSLSGPKGFKANGRGWTIRVMGTDPLGKWKPQSGVIGTAIKMAQARAVSKPAKVPDEIRPDIPDPVLPAATAKTSSDMISVTSILSKPEAGVGILASASGVITAASGNTVIGYAIAGAIVMATLVAGYYFIKRIRSANA